MRPTRPRQTATDRQVASEDAPTSGTAESTAPSAEPHDSAEAPTAVPNRAYYQFYLISGPGGEPELRGEQQIVLKLVSARTCATVLEVLCVPLGRSGSEHECYLLYEDHAEFDAATRLAPALDVAPLVKPGSGTEGMEAFESALGLFYGLIDAGPPVNRALVGTAERQFAEAARTESLDAERRWAAAILSARLASEYRYDYTAAAAACAGALKLAGKHSLEALVALYWEADACSLAGKKAEAQRMYEEILAIAGTRTARSELTRRAREALSKTQKR